MAADTINTKAGSEFSVRLPANASTGYVWEIESLPKGVELLGSGPEAKPGTETKPGDSTTKLFRFRANSAGKYEICFQLKRKWEKTPIETKTVVVDAQ